jgi:hypothetical protein
VPVIYNLSLTGGQLQFSVGGYLSASGIQIQTSPNLIPGGWQTIAAMPVGTNKVTFSTNILQQDAPTFFRIQNSGP